MKFSIIIPVFNGSTVWEAAAAALKIQTKKAERILVIDSGSTDGSLETTKKADFELIEISSDQFDHGATRQMGVDLLDQEEIVVFITQDAVLKSENAIEQLLSAFSDAAVGAAYGRQLPRQGAGIIEAYARDYNYPEKSSVKTKEDIQRLGIKAAFCSNSFAAYRVSSLKAVGGFPEKTIFAEDMLVSAKMLLAGFKVAYCAEAQCIHSHAYTVLQEFERSFDIGVFHSCETWLIEKFGKAEDEGKRYTLLLLKKVFLTKPSNIFKAVLLVIAKIAGYKLGKLEKKIPKEIKILLGMNKNFWRVARQKKNGA